MFSRRTLALSNAQPANNTAHQPWAQKHTHHNTHSQTKQQFNRCSTILFVASTAHKQRHAHAARTHSANTSHKHNHAVEAWAHNLLTTNSAGPLACSNSHGERAHTQSQSKLVSRFRSVGLKWSFNLWIKCKRKICWNNELYEIAQIMNRE
jgi:hypothetical protein